MNVDGQPGGGANGSHDERPHRDVRDEAPVHDVDVNPVGPGGLDRTNLFGEAAEVSRKNRRRDQAYAGDSRSRHLADAGAPVKLLLRVLQKATTLGWS